MLVAKEMILKAASSNQQYLLMLIQNARIMQEEIFGPVVSIY